MEEGRYTIQSVKKAIEVLSLFVQSEEGYTFTEIANAFPDLNRSNILRILSTLKEGQCLSYDSGSGLYTRGPFFLPLERRSEEERLRSLLLPRLQEAAREAGMIVHFTTAGEAGLKIIIRAFPSASFESLALASTEEGSVPVNATGAGKIFAAFADESLAAALVDGCPFHRYSQNTITDRAEFLRIVEKVRVDGYALNIQEHEEFLCCLSRPVFSKEGSLVGALSFSGFKEMFQGGRYEAVDALSRRLSAELSKEL